MFTYSSEIKQSFIFKEVVTRVKEKKPTKFYIQKQFVKEMWNNSELEHLHTCIFKEKFFVFLIAFIDIQETSYGSSFPFPLSLLKYEY